MTLTRRDFMKQAGFFGAGFISTGWLTGETRAIASQNKPVKPSDDVSPVEDLMREHGVVERLLLIFEEAARRLSSQLELPPEPLAAAVRINRNFVENYHERLEENYLFPRLKKAGQQVDLVNTLLRQHQAGRQLTDTMLRTANAQSFKNPQEKQALVHALNQYLHMYRPHAAREDTVLFPAFKTIVSAHEYDALGEAFEDEEHRLFGKAGFEGIVAEIAELEKQLGIYDLNRWTPQTE